jgi:acetyl coenzyme A synthetase (ADP forming)-like protein
MTRAAIDREVAPVTEAAFEAPATTDTLLADGTTARLRPATPEDREALVAFHAGLSREATTLRYFTVHPRLTEADLERIVRLDPDHCSLIAERSGHIVALGEYHRALGSEDADVAFVVDDDFQGRGLGTILLEHLADQARRHGVRRFTADTLFENAKMLEVFRSAGYVSTRTLEHGVVHVVLDIAPSAESIAAAQERDRHAVVRSMNRLLQPRSVAVIGASRREGSIGLALVKSLLAGDFAGPIYPVNPKADSVAGVPCWPSVGAVPGDVDLAIIAVPAASVIDVVKECGEASVGGLVVVSSGFAEVGEDGVETQRRLTTVAHELGMRLVGPNCFGVVNTDPSVSMNATFAPEPPLPGGVGFASQSGGLGIAIVAEARQRGIGLSSFVSMGNKADVSGNDVLAWWEADRTTKVALLYLESFGNPRKFARLARRIGRTKPIVAVKAGRSGAGAAAASSHTAAMASSDLAVDALFRQCGVVRVETVEELFDVAEILSDQPIPQGDRVGILTNAGGPGVLAADACSRLGLQVPTLSDPLQGRLFELQAGIASVRNPVDLAASATSDAFAGGVQLLLESGEVDSVVVIFTPPVVTRAAAVAAGVVEGAERAWAAGHARPLVATFFGAEAGRRGLAAANRAIPCYTYPETAVRALAHVASYGKWRARPARELPTRQDCDVNAARALLAEHDEDGWLDGASAMAVVRAFGIPATTTILVHDADEAATAAASVGFPVALKAAGRGIIHKTDAGGVKLGLADETAVTAAFTAMRAAVGPSMTGALLQPMAEPGVEVIVGATQESQFGPVVLVGAGGTQAEIFADNQLALAPVTEVEARQMVLSLRASPLLTGFRGSEPVDLDAVVEVVVRMGLLADALPEVAEIDCNPVVARPDGVLAIDARIRVTIAS